MHCGLRQPASPARCASRFVVVYAAPSLEVGVSALALPIEPHTLVVALCLRLADSNPRGRCAAVAASVLLYSMPVLPTPVYLAR
jgi:hypothetical protein